MALFLNMAQKKYNAFDHASHNLKVHNYIKQSTEFPDWEITTAFYCSLKFFEGSLFGSRTIVVFMQKLLSIYRGRIPRF